MSVLPVALSMLFLIVVAFLGVVIKQGEEPDWYIYCSYLLPQLSSLFILLIFMKCKQTSVKSICRKVKWKYFLIAVVLQFGLFSFGKVNAWFLETLGKIGYAEQEVIVPSMDGFGFVGVLFAIAVLPAVFEELMCREFLLNGLKSFGTVFAVLVSGALFALYHQKPEQTIYQFCCGMAFALVAIKSNSVFPTMISHFLNNAFILTVEKFGWQIINTPFLISSAICLIGSLTYLIFFDKKQDFEEREKNVCIEEPKKKDFFIFSAIGIFTFGLTWLSKLFIGF